MKMLTENTLNKLKDIIATELLKRGFTAPLTLSIDSIYKNSLDHGSRIKLESASFQTTPVIFKDIKVCNFGGALTPKEDGMISVWIPVNVKYQLFGGGTNGCELFTLWCEIDGEYIDNITISQLNKGE